MEHRSKMVVHNGLNSDVARSNWTIPQILNDLLSLHNQPANTTTESDLINPGGKYPDHSRTVSDGLQTPTEQLKDTLSVYASVPSWEQIQILIPMDPGPPGHIGILVCTKQTGRQTDGQTGSSMYDALPEQCMVVKTCWPVFNTILPSPHCIVDFVLGIQNSCEQAGSVEWQLASFWASFTCSLL